MFKNVIEVPLQESGVNVHASQVHVLKDHVSKNAQESLTSDGERLVTFHDV